MRHSSFGGEFTSGVRLLARPCPCGRPELEMAAGSCVNKGPFLVWGLGFKV